MINAKRDKRAYIAYMSELLLKQKEDPQYLITNGNETISLEEEITKVEGIINDLDFYINTHA
jgi:hypothetical protein